MTMSKKILAAILSLALAALLAVFLYNRYYIRSPREQIEAALSRIDDSEIASQCHLFSRMTTGSDLIVNDPPLDLHISCTLDDIAFDITTDLLHRKGPLHMKGSFGIDRIRNVGFTAAVDDKSIRARIPLISDDIFRYDYTADTKGYLSETFYESGIEAFNDFMVDLNRIEGAELLPWLYGEILDNTGYKADFLQDMEYLRGFLDPDKRRGLLESADITEAQPRKELISGKSVDTKGFDMAFPDGHRATIYIYEGLPISFFLYGNQRNKDDKDEAAGLMVYYRQDPDEIFRIDIDVLEAEEIKARFHISPAVDPQDYRLEGPDIYVNTITRQTLNEILQGALDEYIFYF